MVAISHPCAAPGAMFAVYCCATIGFVIPAIVNVAACPLASVQSAFVSPNVIVSVLAANDPVVVSQSLPVLTNPVKPAIVGAAGTVKLVGNSSVIVFVFTSAPAPLAVKPSVHVSTFPAICAGADIVAAVTAVASAFSAGPANSITTAMSAARVTGTPYHAVFRMNFKMRPPKEA